MKKVIPLIVTICILTACQPQEINESEPFIQKVTDNSFSDQEIKAAKDLVREKFNDFQGCTLLKLWYDEEVSQVRGKDYMTYGRGKNNGVTSDNVMILRCEFYTDDSGRDGFNPNMIYRDWVFILIRDSKDDALEIDDWGI